MTQSCKVLVVDDELGMRESIGAWLQKEGYRPVKAASGEEALALMEKESFELALVDIKMPGMDGLELLNHIKAHYPETLVVIITAYGSIESSVRAMKEGAADYLLKPFDPEQLILLLEKISTQRALLRENLALRQRLSEGDSAGFGDLIGQSPAMLSIFNLIEEISGSEAPVLITGETGTGKELVARAIHNHSRRAFGPYVTINCGAQTESLLESELFGHERGAFTGAVKARRGRLELADGGTLFLDEVGEISQKMQLNLLRVLEDKRFQRVGGSQTLSSDFRVICATHRDLPALIKEENFRQDFYFRINVISVPIPPLRQRPEDIIPLAEHFVDFFARQTGRAPLELDHSARTLLVNYSWPGNVRELRNVMERAVIVAKSPKIQAGQLTFLSVTPETEPPSFTLAQAELNHIHKALEAHDWNITQAAKALGIDRSTLRRKMKKMELQAPT